MDFSRQTLIGALFVGGVLIIDGFVLVEERSEPEGMIWVDAGDYTSMAEDMPADRVEVAGFWIDSEAITEEEFAEFVQQTEYLRGNDTATPTEDFDYNLPVELATQDQQYRHKFHLAYEDARAYCHWLGKKLVSKVQAAHAGMEINYGSFHCIKPHRSNDLATLWLKD